MMGDFGFVQPEDISPTPPRSHCECQHPKRPLLCALNYGHAGPHWALDIVGHPPGKGEHVSWYYGTWGATGGQAE